VHPSGIHLSGKSSVVCDYRLGDLSAYKVEQPMLHYKAVARNKFWKISDIILCIFGIIAMGYTTSLTLINWAQAPSGPALPSHCDGK